MKARKFMMTIVSIGLVFGMMSGCGGGGGDGTPVAGTGLNENNVNESVGDIADELGCTYTPLTAQAAQKNVVLSLNATGLLKKTIEKGKLFKEAPLLAAAVTETVPGDCGGSMTIITDDAATPPTMNVTLSNYCVTDTSTGVNTTINGSLSATASESTDSMTLTASTPTPITINSTNPNTNESVSGTIDLNGGSLTINSDGSMSVSVSSLTIIDNVNNDTYTVTNLSATMNADGSVTFSGTFTVPDIGTLTVSGSVDAYGQGSITLTDANNNQATITPTSTEGVFNVSFENTPQGTMDCSMVELPELPVQ